MKTKIILTEKTDILFTCYICGEKVRSAFYFPKKEGRGGRRKCWCEKCDEIYTSFSLEPHEKKKEVWLNFVIEELRKGNYNILYML